MALSTPVRIVIAAAALGATAFLVFSDSGEGVLEYVYVDKVAENPDHFAGRELKVHGTVVPGTIQHRPDGGGEYRFTIEHAGKKLDVHFTNMVPDTFKEGGEVILTGKLNGGRFESEEMTAKCPSKYEEEANALAQGEAPPRS